MYAIQTHADAHMNVSSLLSQCIDSARLLEDVDVEGNPGVGVTLVPKVAAIIISYILHGYCFTQRNLPSPTFFTDYIFQSLNSTNNLQIIGKFLKIQYFVPTF